MLVELFKKNKLICFKNAPTTAQLMRLKSLKKN